MNFAFSEIMTTTKKRTIHRESNGSIILNEIDKNSLIKIMIYFSKSLWIKLMRTS
jgi:hypothetical protein